MKRINKLIVMFLTFISCILSISSCTTSWPIYDFNTSIFYNIINDTNILYNNEVHIGIGHTFDKKIDSRLIYDDNGELRYNSIVIRYFIDCDSLLEDSKEVDAKPIEKIIIDGNDFLDNYQMKNYDDVGFFAMQKYERYSKVFSFNFDDLIVKEFIYITIAIYDNNQIMIDAYGHMIYGSKEDDIFYINKII